MLSKNDRTEILQIDSKVLEIKFKTAQPFPHLVIDNFFSEGFLTGINEEFDIAPKEDWLKYDSPDEKGKRIYNKQNKDKIPLAATVIKWLASKEFCSFAGEIAGIQDLESDPSFYGGCLHSIETNGYLNLHLDNEIHPQTGMLRRLNLILFCNKEYKQEWKGELEFWNITRTKCITKIQPLPNRLVLFVVDNRSFHGHPSPWLGPIERRSIAIHYWSKPRPRALFIPKANEQEDIETQLRRKQRSER